MSIHVAVILLLAAARACESSKLAAAWMYIADADWCPPGVYDFNYTSVPSYWESIDYSKVDILLVGPIGVQQGAAGEGAGTIGLVGATNAFNKTVSWCGTSEPVQLVDANFGSLDRRFAAVLAQARERNPAISIRASIWWSDESCPNNEWGRGMCVARDYSEMEMMELARSARDFLERWKLQGLDIDYESGNVFPKISMFLKAAKLVFDGAYELSIAPATKKYVQKSRPYLDQIFMQTYEGGAADGINPMFFLRKGFDSKQLFYGLCPESNCHQAPTLRYATTKVVQYTLAGTHLWRLNSDNYVVEDGMQKNAYKVMNSLP